MAISEPIRLAVWQRAGRRCEYCRSPEWVSPSSFSAEHIIPASRGGISEVENLALSCQGCNNHKYTATTAVDPETGETAQLFHPRRDRWTDHFAWSKSLLEVVGLTPSGRATRDKLKLNRPNLINLRQVLITSGDHPPLD